MKGKAIIPLVAGLAIGLFAVKLAVDTIRKAQAAGAKTGIVKVVRATRDISPYEELKADAIEVIETEENMFISKEDRIESVEEVFGRVTAKSILHNAPVLRSNLAPEGTPPGMVGRIPEGYRAVSVQISEVTAVAYQIQPGDWVDVIVVMDVSTPVGGRKTIAEVILERVQVAAIGDTTSPVSSSGKGNTRPARSVTLFVVEEDVPKLHLAATQGKITLAMRGDDTTLDGSHRSASMDDLIKSNKAQPKITPPADWMKGLVSAMNKKPEPVQEEEPPPHAVTVYRSIGGGTAGQNIERLTFENGQSSRILDVSYGPNAGPIMTRKQNSGRTGNSKRVTSSVTKEGSTDE
jgi:pilus assembly protein CpaB